MDRELRGSVEKGKGGWWVAQVGVDSIDPAVLRSACNESQLLRWDGLVGRYSSEADAAAALAEALMPG